MNRRIAEIAEAVGARVIGDTSIEVSGISGIATASAGHLIFAEDKSSLSSALQSNAAAVISGSFAETATTSKVLLIAAHPRLAFARAAAMMRDRSGHSPEVHAKAFVHPSATLGREVSIGANAVVQESAIVGNRTCIGAGCVIS